MFARDELATAAKVMAEEAVAVVVDDFLPRELCDACTNMCIEGLGPLLVSLGQREHGRDDLIFVFGSGEPAAGGDDALPSIRTPRGVMKHEKLRPLVATSAALKSLHGPLSEAMGIEVGVPQLAQLARYTAGSVGYAWHKDNTIDDSSEGVMDGPRGQRICDRLVTAILYLTDSFDSAEANSLSDTRESSSTGRVGCVGGSLSVVDPSGGERKLQPRPGRLVIFNSRSVLHQVERVVEGDRWALSLWFTYPESMWL